MQFKKKTRHLLLGFSFKHSLLVTTTFFMFFAYGIVKNTKGPGTRLAEAIQRLTDRANWMSVEHGGGQHPIVRQLFKIQPIFHSVTKCSIVGKKWVKSKDTSYNVHWRPLSRATRGQLEVILLLSYKYFRIKYLCSALSLTCHQKSIVFSKYNLAGHKVITKWCYTTISVMFK